MALQDFTNTLWSMHVYPSPRVLETVQFPCHTDLWRLWPPGLTAERMLVPRFGAPQLAQQGANNASASGTMHNTVKMQSLSYEKCMTRDRTEAASFTLTMAHIAGLAKEIHTSCIVVHVKAGHTVTITVPWLTKSNLHPYLSLPNSR